MTTHPDLRSLALAATPGPWRVYGPWPKATVYVDDDSEADDSIVPTWVADCGECDPHAGQIDCAQHPNAAFIAAASPDVVVALLDELDRARELRDEAIVNLSAEFNRRVVAERAIQEVQSNTASACATQAMQSLLDLRAQLAAVTAERDAYRRAKQENDERYMIERDAARAEVERMRAVLDLPMNDSEHRPRAHNKERVIFRLHGEDHVVSADYAHRLGAAMIKAALTAQREEQSK